jgi:MtN3 and saliva related transmembrane protein
MNLADFFGYTAAFLTTICWLPQAVRIIRTRKTAGLSALTYGGFALGIACWLVYGILIGSMPVIAANVVTLFLAAIILGLIFLHRPRKIR